MKKLLIYLLLLLPLALVSCGSDDDEPSTGLSGTWVKNDLTDGDSHGSWTFKFSGNNVIYTEKWSESGHENDVEVYSGTYETFNDHENDPEKTKYLNMHVTYTYSGGSSSYDWEFAYSISGKELTLTPISSETRNYFGSSSFVLKRK